VHAVERNLLGRPAPEITEMERPETAITWAWSWPGVWAGEPAQDVAIEAGHDPAYLVPGCETVRAAPSSAMHSVS